MIDADPDGGSTFFANIDKLGEFLPGCRMVFVEIARVYADLVHKRSNHKGQFAGEMDICNYGSEYAFRTQPEPDILDMFHIGGPRNGYPYELRTCFVQSFALLICGFFIIGMGVAHRLYNNCRVT